MPPMQMDINYPPISRELNIYYLLWKLFISKIMVSKENIDQINTTGHVLNVCISIYIL